MGTIGVTAVGATDGGANVLLACGPFTCPSADTITKITAYLRNTGSDSVVGVAIYEDNGSGTFPNGALLAQDSGNVTISGASFAWYDFTISYAFSSSQVIWLAFWAQNTTDIHYAYDAATKWLAYNFSGSFESYPNPGDATNAVVRDVSIYATYGATASSVFTVSSPLRW